MKILFFSEDENVHDLIEGVNHQNMVVSDDSDQILELSEDERSLIFLDFDDDKKAAEKLNKKLLDGDDVRIIMTESMKLKELKKHQKGKTAAHGYVRKPLTLKVINEILNDFEMSDFIEESEAFNEGDALGEAQLSKIGGGDFEDDHTDSEVDFSAGVMKVDDRVKEQLDAHSVAKGDETNFATPLNVDIQSKFDLVFDRPFYAQEEEPSEVNIPAPEEQQANSGGPSLDASAGGFDLDMGDDEAEEDADLDLSADEEDADLDLSADEEDADLDLSADESSEVSTDEVEDLDINIEETEEPEAMDLSAPEDAPPQEEAAMKDDDELDLGLEPEEEIDLDEGALEFGGAAEEVEDEVEDDSVEGLDFGGESEDGASDDLVASKEESEEENKEESEADSGGFELGDDSDDGSLSLGGVDDDAGALDLGGDDDDAGGLDLGGDDDDAGALDLGGDDDDAGALDLGADDDSGSLDLGEPDSEDNLDLGAEEDEDLSEDVDEVSAVLEDIVSDAEDDEDSGELNIGAEFSEDDEDDEELDLGASEEVDLEEELNLGDDEEEDSSEVLDFSDTDEGTGEIDAPDMTETDSEVLDLGEAEDEDIDEFAEETNPTVVVAAEDDSLREFKAPIPGSETEDEEDEDEIFDLDEDDEEDIDLDATVTEVVEPPKPEEPAEEVVAEAVEKVEETVQAREEAPEQEYEPIVITPEEQRVAEAFNQTELARLQGTIRQLREEREELLKEIHELKTDSKLGDQERLGLQAELDEAKIEIQILKKRSHDEVDELKYQLRLSEEKKQIFEERSRSVQKEFDRLNQKVRIDINQVKQREKELESQLELVTMDSQSQVKSRDMKILDLKRKIDALEFNMENASIREIKSREDKERVEERLEKIMRTLRGSLKSLESDVDDSVLDKIDKL